MTNTVKVASHALIFALMLSIAPWANAGENRWLAEMSPRLKMRIPNEESRTALLKAVHYESGRIGLNPQLVLSVIDVASGFKKYAVSAEGARGFMQVSPSWAEKIGAPRDNLFGLQINIRYGCVILRHFLDLENGDLSKALARYRSQMGGLVEVEGAPIVSPSDFPRTVERMSKTRWWYDGPRGQQHMPKSTALLTIRSIR